MKNREALVKAREVLEVNLKANQIPARADVSQLVHNYPMRQAIKVLDNLIELFPMEDV